MGTSKTCSSSRFAGTQEASFKRPFLSTQKKVLPGGGDIEQSSTSFSSVLFLRKTENGRRKEVIELFTWCRNVRGGKVPKGLEKKNIP